MEPPSKPPVVSGSLHRQLFAISFLALFFELMVIRWAPSVVHLVAYYANLMLISSFLGLGIGAMLSNHRRSLFELFPLLLCVQIGVFFTAGQMTLPSPAQEQRFNAFPSSNIEGYVILVLIFAVNAIAFVPLGQRIGQIFQNLPPLRAYSWDLAGSLAGTLVFGIFSFAHFSPLIGFCGLIVVYLLVSPLKRWLATGAFFVIVLSLLFFFNERAALWSPYYYITVRLAQQLNGISSPPISEPVDGLRNMIDPPIYSVSVNQDFYQMHGTLNPRRYTPGLETTSLPRDLFRQYSLPYLLASRHERVAVMGAGGGMDVEAALLNGAAHVDAVEIDPRLVALSHRFSAADVYSDSRVQLHITDARAFLRSSKSEYDMIVFGFLDSQALFSYMSNLRLDGYIYTVQSLRNAWRLLTDDGVLSLSFVRTQPWLAEKLTRMLAVATDTTPIVYLSDANLVLIARRGATTNPPRSIGEFLLAPIDPSKLRDSTIPLATDDWPYLYLSQRTIPLDYQIVIGALLAVSVATVLTLRRRSLGRADWHFLFMGMGFLLLETKSIGDCSLYFGTTWLVTMIVITGVLLMVLTANLLAIRQTSFSRWLYLPLLLSLLILYLVPRDSILGMPLIVRLIWSVLVVPLPIFFAGLIFSLTFREGGDPAQLLGANLIGAMFGGFAEYLAMMTGQQALMLIVVGAYLASFACVRLPRRVA